MLEKLSQSFGNVLGYQAIGTITREDYSGLIGDVEAILQQENSVRLLLDLEEFKGEEISAWGADLRFGRDYRKRIDKLAIVGDKKWQEWLTALADPFYAGEAKLFLTDQREAAWEWLET